LGFLRRALAHEIKMSRSASTAQVSQVRKALRTCPGELLVHVFDFVAPFGVIDVMGHGGFSGCVDDD
jgi:hypothetical protein